MNREFKFKFWLSRSKKMTQEHSLNDIANAFWDFDEKIIPLQFTGQIDCNKNEIYEGDIIRISDFDSIYEVVFTNGSFRLAHLKQELNGYIWGTLERILDLSDKYPFKVIGNIYETPELLTDACETQKC